MLHPVWLHPRHTKYRHSQRELTGAKCNVDLIQVSMIPSLIIHREKIQKPEFLSVYGRLKDVLTLKWVKLMKLLEIKHVKVYIIHCYVFFQ